MNDSSSSSSLSPARASSVVTYRIGGREYPLKSVANCKVCKSPHRFTVEQQILRGNTYRSISEGLPTDADLSVGNIGKHFQNKHMPLQVEPIRRLVENRARQVGKSIEDSEDNLVDGVVLAEAVVQRVFEAIVEGEIEPSVRDGLRATKMLADLGVYDQGGLDQEAFESAFEAYHEEVGRVLSVEQFDRLSRALASNPILAALARRYEQTVEGEVLREVGPSLAPLSDSFDSDGDG